RDYPSHGRRDTSCGSPNLWIHHRPAIRKRRGQSLLCQSSNRIQPLTPAGLTPRKSSRVDRKFSTKLADFTGNGLQHLSISYVIESPADEIADLLHLFLFHAPRRHRRGAASNAAGYERRARVEWDRILVNRDACPVERLLGDLPGQFRFAQIDQHQVIVRPP